MPYRLATFADAALTDGVLEHALERHEREALPRLERLWRYYRNPMQSSRVGRAYRLGQEDGLPPRITGRASATATDDRAGPAERVIENDIAWRVQSMVDFLLGRPVRIISTAREAALREIIDRVLDRVIEDSGGIALLQDIALLGQVYGHVDLLLRVDDELVRGVAATAGGSDPLERALRAAAGLRVEVIEPRRGVPFNDDRDYRTLRAYAVRFERETDQPAGVVDRVISRVLGGNPNARQRVEVLELISANAHQVYEDGRLVWSREGTATGGELPIVHIQNVAEPFAYSGLSEVEALIPLQDELNTRLSDRATRVTFQSFTMLLAKGVDGFERTPVRPGQVWVTDNPDAKIEAFGGDAESPSEEAHIRDIREAMDKVSGVPPLAGGVVQGRIGNLSSANALRVTLMGVLAKTARKRVTYGRGLSQMCRLILAALDQSGALPTSGADRGVRFSWPDPLPEDLHDAVLIAKGKAELGVPAERVREELGYATTDDGIGG